MGGEGRGVQRFIHARLGVVLGAQPALLHHHLDLAGKLLGLQLQVRHAVGLEPHHPGQRSLRHDLEVRGVVEARKGVVAPPRLGDALVEFAGFQCPGALEHHVLEDVGDARGAVLLVHRPDAVPDHVDGGRGAPVFLDDHAQAVGERLFEGGLGGRKTRRRQGGEQQKPAQRKRFVFHMSVGDGLKLATRRHHTVRATPYDSLPHVWFPQERSSRRGGRRRAEALLDRAPQGRSRPDARHAEYPARRIVFPRQDRRGTARGTRVDAADGRLRRRGYPMAIGPAARQGEAGENRITNRAAHRADRADDAAAGAARAAARPLPPDTEPAPLHHHDRRCERRGQDHLDRQARQAVPEGGPRRAAGRRRHLPRRGARAARRMGPPQRRDRGRPGIRRPGRRGVRRDQRGARARHRRDAGRHRRPPADAAAT